MMQSSFESYSALRFIKHWVSAAPKVSISVILLQVTESDLHIKADASIVVRRRVFSPVIVMCTCSLARIHYEGQTSVHHLLHLFKHCMCLLLKPF